jgi:hypothetical protein
MIRDMQRKRSNKGGRSELDPIAYAANYVYSQQHVFEQLENNI